MGLAGALRGAERERGGPLYPLYSASILGHLLREDLMISRRTGFALLMVLAFTALLMPQASSTQSNPNAFKCNATATMTITFFGRGYHYACDNTANPCEDDDCETWEFPSQGTGCRCEETLQPNCCSLYMDSTGENFHAFGPCEGYGCDSFGECTLLIQSLPSPFTGLKYSAQCGDSPM